MKPDTSDKRRAQAGIEQGRVDLWTPWGVLRSTRAEEAARQPRKKPQPGAWPPPPLATRKDDCKPRA
jgi:hypothetical protein